MAKIPLEKSDKQFGGTTDQSLLETVDAMYQTGFSPAEKMRLILNKGHENFREFVRATARRLLQAQETLIFDHIIMNSNIRAEDDRWVSNTARLCENAISDQIADELFDVSCIIRIEELRTEILAKLQPLIDRRTERKLAYAQHEEAVAQAMAAGRANGRIPPPVPVPNIIMPSDAFPLHRLQPYRSGKIPRKK